MSVWPVANQTFASPVVGIMADADTIIHSSRRWMGVKAEPLADVVARSAAKGHEPAVTGCKRPR